MRISVSSIVDSQLPAFVREEYPLFSEFLKQYYISDVSQEIVQNLEHNLDIDVIFNLRSQAVLTEDIDYNNDTIYVDSTEGFPDAYGLIKIDNEIILYTSKTENQFLNCVRGFSGISKIDQQSLEFSDTVTEQHFQNSIVYNLSVLFLQKFALSVKKRITPGFEEREFFSELNSLNFVKNIQSFYTSKGSDESFRILFGALYGKSVDIIKPRDFLIRPSNAQYRVTKDIVVDVIEGDPYQLINSTVYQDQTDSILPAQGTIIDVNKIIRNNKEYFILSLDYDYNRDVDVSGTVRSEFSIHPKTLSTSNILAGSSYIDVDSTVGFPDIGSLKIYLENGDSFIIDYQFKTLTQFLECSNIILDIPEKSEIKTPDLIYGVGLDGLTVLMRVTGVLGDIDYVDKTYGYIPKEEIKIKTLGEDSKEFKANNWFFNVPVTYDVENIQFEDTSDLSYKITTYDEHSFVIGDSFTLYSSDGNEFNGIIFFIEDENNVITRGQGELNLNLTYKIRKKVSKVNISNSTYSDINIYNSNVENIYLDYDKNIYVSSPSLPSYLDYSLDIKDFSLKVPAKNYTGLNEIVFSFPHGLFTGDSIIYRPVNSDNSIIDFGLYYVKKVSDNIIKLSRSLSNIDKSIYITFNGVINSGFESELTNSKFSDINFNKLKIKPQNIIKKLSEPEVAIKKEDTEPGSIGILVNGVEISNFKSNDILFYGGISEVEVSSTENNYNIIEPPQIKITDSVGFGATLIASVEGSLEKINIIDPGFNYIEQPTISITGGGGEQAEAIANLVTFTHSVDFNAEKLVNINNDTIEFIEDHKFNDNEEIIYKTNNQKNILGISTESIYYIKVINAKAVKLHYNINDSVSGINTINFTGIGSGIHSLVSTQPKKRISHIDVINSGFGYKNRRVKITGINTTANSLIINHHQYSNGEIIKYFPQNQVISGLTSATSYYVTVVDDQNIKLSGISTIERPDANYLKKEYIEITSFNSDNHYFNYPEIEVKIKGKIGTSPLPGQDFNAVIQPIFSGKIYSVFIENSGQLYGSKDIINYERKPTVEIESAGGAQVTPIISNGSIVKVLVNSSGTGYQQVPELIVEPRNSGAILTPVISNGKLVDVIVVDGGSGFDSNTTISIQPKENNAKFDPKIEYRRINIVEKLILTENISRDDGYIFKNVNSLQYSHLYSPRSLRESILRKVGNLNTKDLNFNFGKEQISNVHSPLIGWSYDGNPIYGPYGYSNSNSGPVKALRSGYRLKTSEELLNENRPSLELYPIGFFVEDYIFDNSGDLDVYNGRYCVTPEFPNGTYAYFCTISDFISDSSSPFFNYFAPVFPYIIGPQYKNKQIKDQIDFKLLGDKILRNTTPYNLISDRSNYEFIVNPNKIKENTIKIVKTKSSTIDNINILQSGNNYKVNESIYLTDGTNAKIKTISGVAVSSIGIAYTFINNIEVVPFKDNFIGISSFPHQIDHTQKFKFNSEYEIDKSILATPYYNTLYLLSEVNPPSVTGIITYFTVSGNLNFPLKENDIYIINNEKIKILKIDSTSSRIKVKRNESGISGISTHPSNSLLVEDSRKLSFDLGISTNYNFKVNQEFYFDPNESLGIGTNGNYTLNISNAGIGKTILTIPVKSLYLENHQLVSGDSLFYSSNDGSSISISTSGIGSTTLTYNQELYVTKINNDLIGLSTEKSGVGTTDSILYFIGIGTGNNHSLKTNYDNKLIGNLSKNTVIVSTATSHNLNLNDTIFMNVSSGIQTNYKIFYNDYNRRICVNKRFITSIDILNNTIYIENHKFEKGEAVIYVSNSSVGGLQNQKIYYVIPITKDIFKLAENQYDSIQDLNQAINLTSSGTGYFYSISPSIKIIKDQNIIFDVSDESLSFEYGNIKYPAFDLKLYNNKELTDEYFTYDLVKEGIVGIDSTAKYTLITKNIPNKIYYSLDKTNISILPQIKKEIYLDTDQDNLFELKKIDSYYSGEYNLIGISSNTFRYNINNYPEIDQYNTVNSTLIYNTNSLNVSGPIDSIKIINYENTNKLPEIEKISTLNGIDAILEADSTSIGEIINTEKVDIGFEYNIDYTIRPKINIPKIIKLESTYSLDEILVTNNGFGYSYSPDLLLFNNLTKTVYSNVKLDYNLKENKVTIIENINNIKDKNLKVITTNNDNGFDIEEITYNNTTKNVVVKLKTGFSTITDYPFNVGENVLIENVSIIPNVKSKGYNSSNYDYTSFRIIESTPNIGGIGATFVYSLNGLIGIGLSTGVVDDFYTNGFAIPEKYIPTFEIKLKENEFAIGENIKTSSDGKGIVVSSDIKNSTIKVISNSDIKINESIYSETSKNNSTIINVYSPQGYIDVDSNSIVRKGWTNSVGFLNDNLQRIHDNDYYQYFSYDLRSEIDYSNWTDLVDSLNHTTGFKKFGNLLINSTNENIGITTDQNLSDFDIINDLYAVEDVNCYNDFDLVTENYFTIDNDLKSNEIYFKSRRIQNYIESIGNKVILIDDISNNFKPNTPEDVSIIDSFNKFDYRFKKYIIHVADRLDLRYSQSLLLNLLHNNTVVGINQYSINETIDEIGYFDANISGVNVNLTFNPIIKSNKIYSINNFSYNISDFEDVAGETSVGDIIKIQSYNVTGIGTTVIAGISSTKSAVKIMLVYSDLNNICFYSDELNYIHDGNKIYYNSYGELNLGKASGIGTYNLYYSGSNINVEFHPNEQFEYKLNSLAIQMSNNSLTDSGFILLSGNKLESTHVGVASTGIPAKTLIYSHSNNYNCGLHQIVISDSLNKDINYIEYFGVLNSSNQDVYSIDFGRLNTKNEMGLFQAEYSDVNGNLELYFTPYNDIDYQVRIFSTLISKFRRSETLEV